MELPTATQLKDALGISASYASMIRSGVRVPPIDLALRIRRSFGVKIGPIAATPDEDIPALERQHLEDAA
jgi:transcriptional regulator with XRE-family HTH domain